MGFFFSSDLRQYPRHRYKYGPRILAKFHRKPEQRLQRMHRIPPIDIEFLVQIQRYTTKPKCPACNQPPAGSLTYGDRDGGPAVSGLLLGYRIS